MEGTPPLSRVATDKEIPLVNPKTQPKRGLVSSAVVGCTTMALAVPAGPVKSAKSNFVSPLSLAQRRRLLRRWRFAAVTLVSRHFRLAPPRWGEAPLRPRPRREGVQVGQMAVTRRDSSLTPQNLPQVPALVTPVPLAPVSLGAPPSRFTQALPGCEVFGS